ncbi:hypothetical protein IDM40_23025 [Nocardiopsis sp. HNM0947]|uniref:PQQ-like domain-containing protein n=1 Tax=Nocardiopsis coralli TaxID=2772213 RepID=A0ABR9PCH6_9ACTN|nr:hypothetical protein [Nocardiopsis coralli]MBE3001542.1 hypothetical protein [Nocardiopsis coralli]
MSRSLAPAALACALTLLATSCSLLDLLEDGDPDHDPTAISPDEPVHCEDEGEDDCGEPGVVRWSVPLEGEHHVYRERGGFGDDLEDGMRLAPVREISAGRPQDPGGVVHEGTLYYHEHDRVTAVDAESGDIHWSRSEVDADHTFRARTLHAVDGMLVLHSWDERGIGSMVHFAEASEDEPEWTRAELDLDALVRITPATDGAHLVIGETEGSGDDRSDHPDRLHLVDRETGETTLTTDEPGDHVFAREVEPANGRSPGAVTAEAGPASGDRLTAPLEVTVEGSGEELVMDHASGPVLVTDYTAADGTLVAVFQGCAPDGPREETPDSPAPGNPCDAPRLFAVDLAG